MCFYSLINPSYKEIIGQTVSVIGGGGKSSLIYRIAKELADEGLKTIITSTTKIESRPGIGIVLQNKNPNFLTEAESLLIELGLVLVAKDYYKEKELKLNGVARPLVGELKKKSDVVLVEADGSRQKGLKTHKEHEPPVPANSTCVIVICSAENVGEKLNDKNVHRAELFAKKWRISLGTTLTPEIMSRELLSPYSYLKNIPIHANITFFVNKSDKNEIGGKLLAEKLASRSTHPVYLGSLRKKHLERITLQ